MSLMLMHLQTMTVVKCINESLWKVTVVQWCSGEIPTHHTVVTQFSPLTQTPGPGLCPEGHWFLKPPWNPSVDYAAVTPDEAKSRKFFC